MYYRVLGIKKDNFESKDEPGKLIDYRKLYLLDETDKKCGFGGVPFNLSIKEDVYQKLLSEMELVHFKNISLIYDRFNKVVDYQIVDDIYDLSCR